MPPPEARPPPPDERYRLGRNSRRGSNREFSRRNREIGSAPSRQDFPVRAPIRERTGKFAALVLRCKSLRMSSQRFRCARESGHPGPMLRIPPLEPARQGGRAWGRLWAPACAGVTGSRDVGRPWTLIYPIKYWLQPVFPLRSRKSRNPSRGWPAASQPARASSSVLKRSRQLIPISSCNRRLMPWTIRASFLAII